LASPLRPRPDDPWALQLGSRLAFPHRDGGPSIRVPRQPRLRHSPLSHGHREQRANALCADAAPSPKRGGPSL